jgi:TolB protein
VIVTISPDGSAEKQITNPDTASDDEPGVSPDGKTIAFTRLGTTGAQVWTAGIDGSRQRRLDPKDIDGKQVVDERSDPAFSPDGSLVAFNRGWGEVDETKGQIEFSEVYLMDADGRHPRPLTTITKGSLTRATSAAPHGRRTAGRSWSRTSPPCRSPTSTTSTSSRSRVGARDVSRRSRCALRIPIGRRTATILFRTVPPGQDAPGGELYTIHPDGSGMKQLTRSADATLMLSAAYSPDGKWIVFSKGVGGKQPDLYVMKADGSDERRITNSPLWDSRPTWGP